MLLNVEIEVMLIVIINTFQWYYKFQDTKEYKD